MQRTIRGAATALLAATALHAGCIQGDEATTLFPDGSGKVVIKLALKKSVAKMLEAAAKQQTLPENPLDEITNPERMAENSEGVAAWKIGAREEDAEWIRVSYVGYYDDINRVRIYDTKTTPDGARQRVLSYAWKYEPSGKGGTLTLAAGAKETVKDLDGRAAAAGGGEELGKAMLETFKPMFEHFRVSVSVTVPGPVVEFRGFGEKKDRTATYTVDGKSLLDAMSAPAGGEVQRIQGILGARAVWSTSSVTDAEIAAFKKEMSEAKQAWARQRGLPTASPGPTKKKSLAEDVDRFSDDEVNRAFVRAQIKTAKVYIDSGKTKEAREILEYVVKSYGKLKEADEARALLERLDK